MGVFKVIGYTPGEGARASLFGAMAVAEVVEGRLVFRSLVGSGLTDRQLAEFLVRLKSLETERYPVIGDVPRKMSWVKPVMVCKVSFQERTAGGGLRAPVFEGLVEG